MSGLQYRQTDDFEQGERQLKLFYEPLQKLADEYSAINLHDFLIRQHKAKLWLEMSLKKENFTFIHYMGPKNNKCSENFEVPSNECVGRLLKSSVKNNIEFLVKGQDGDYWEYVFFNDKASRLKLIEQCTPADIYKKFINTYNEEIEKEIKISSSKTIRKKHEKLLLQYQEKKYFQDIKFIYHELTKIQDKYKDIQEINLNFQTISPLPKLINFQIILLDKTLNWPLNRKDTELVSINLYKTSTTDYMQDIKKTTIFSVLDNNKTWDNFDRLFLGKDYGWFSKICFHGKLSKTLESTENQKKIKI